MKKLNPRIVWVLFFVFVNVICGIVIYQTHSLLGETEGLGLSDPGIVPWATLLVIASYSIPLLILFPAFAKMKVRSTSFSSRDLSNYVGILVLLLQLGYLAFCLVTGTGTAGSSERPNSFLSPIWVLISPDSLLFLYYGFYRSSRMCLPNVAVGVISSILRGWNGVFIIVIFIESARLMRAGKLKLRHVLMAAAFVIVGYPIIWFAKWQIRSLSGGSGGGLDFSGLLVAFFANLDASGYAEIIGQSFLAMFSRLHLVSCVIAISQNAHQLAGRIDAGSVNSFWREGLLGLVIDRIRGIRTEDLGNALADLINPWHENTWNSNPGYVGWFFVLPLAAPFYLIYTVALGWVSVYLTKKIKADIMTLDMLWFSWCLYLIPGWLATFTIFVFCIGVFYALHLIAVVAVRWKSLLSGRPSSAPTISFDSG